MAKTRLRAAPAENIPNTPSDLALLGEGNSQAKLIFVTNEPSSKAASDLLVKMIEAMGLKKSDVFIAQISDSLTPQALKLSQIQPSLLVSLGESTSQALLNSSTTIAELRGIFRPFQGAKLIATFHPEDLLIKPELKKSVWADLQNVAKELGMTIPSRK